jgi:transcriptional regulator with XRE-family HTH domain
MAKKITARPFSELEARMSKRALEESHRIYAKLREEMALNEIRAAAGLSQQDMAARLKVNQAQVSRMETRSDVRVSTLSKYIRAAGGKLRVMADVNGKMIELKGFAPDGWKVPRLAATAQPPVRGTAGSPKRAAAKAVKRPRVLVRA